MIAKHIWFYNHFNLSINFFFFASREISWGGPRRNQEATTQSRSPLWEQGPNYMNHYLLPPRMCVKRKLKLEAYLGFISNNPTMACGRSTQYPNHCAFVLKRTATWQRREARVTRQQIRLQSRKSGPRTDSSAAQPCMETLSKPSGQCRASLSPCSLRPSHNSGPNKHVWSPFQV